MIEIQMLAIQSFLRLLARRLVDKGVFSQGEMADLHDAWFRDVLALGAELEATGDERDVDGVLRMIHSLTDEFSTK